MTRLARPTGVQTLALALILAIAGTASADALKIGDRLPELDVAVDAGGKAFKLKAQKAGWKLVTVGAAWCKPCAKELPAWDKLAPDWKGKVQFIAVDLDNTVSEGKKFHKDLKLRNMTLAYMPEEKSAVSDSYGAEKMPTTVLVDPKGIVRYVRGGFEKGDVSAEVTQMKDQLDKLVK